MDAPTVASSDTMFRLLVHEASEDASRPLMAAAARGDVGTVRTLLAAHPELSVHTCDGFGSSPLFFLVLF